MVLSRCLLGVGELQADEVKHFGPQRCREILDELAELHLAVRLPRHVDHVDDFVATYAGDRHRFRKINNHRHKQKGEGPGAELAGRQTPSASLIGY